MNFLVDSFDLKIEHGWIAKIIDCFSSRDLLTSHQELVCCHLWSMPHGDDVDDGDDDGDGNGDAPWSLSLIRNFQSLYK